MFSRNKIRSHRLEKSIVDGTDDDDDEEAEAQDTEGTVKCNLVPASPHQLKYFLFVSLQVIALQCI